MATCQYCDLHFPYKIFMFGLATLGILISNVTSYLVYQHGRGTPYNLLLISFNNLAVV